MTNTPARQGDLGEDEEKGICRGKSGQLPEQEKEEERGEKSTIWTKREKKV